MMILNPVLILTTDAWFTACRISGCPEECLQRIRPSRLVSGSYRRSLWSNVETDRWLRTGSRISVQRNARGDGIIGAGSGGQRNLGGRNSRWYPDLGGGKLVAAESQNSETSTGTLYSGSGRSGSQSAK